MRNKRRRRRRRGDDVTVIDSIIPSCANLYNLTTIRHWNVWDSHITNNLILETVVVSGLQVTSPDLHLSNFLSYCTTPLQH